MNEVAIQLGNRDPQRFMEYRWPMSEHLVISEMAVRTAGRNSIVTDYKKGEVVPYNSSNLSYLSSK